MKRQVAVSVLCLIALVLAAGSSTPAGAQDVTSATPGVVLNTDKAVFCAEGTTVKVDLTGVADLYGYQFEVHYDAGKVNASATFLNSFFDTTGPTDAIPPGWNATCSGGVCRFGVSKTDPSPPVSGSGSVAEITFTSVQAGEFDVTIHNDYLSNRDGGAIAHSSAAPLHLKIECVANVSGKVSLQGRPTPLDAGKVRLTDLGGAFAAVETNLDPVTGAFAFTGVKVQLGGSNYQFDVTHSLYLGNRMTQMLQPGVAYTAPDTKLKGGDANNDGLIDVSDRACIGSSFGGAPAVCGATGSSDINHDGTVNVFDLALAGGNYMRSSPQPW
jgi:hypothetical protein